MHIIIFAMLIAFMLILTMITIFLSLSYKVYIFFALIAFMFKNIFFVMLFLILAIFKYKNKGNFKKNNFEFRFEDFSRYNKYEEYNENKNNFYSNLDNEYEKACEILNIDKNMSYDEKKKVYKKMQRKYHPDINKSDFAEEKAKQINNAWDIIEKYEGN